MLLKYYYWWHQDVLPITFIDDIFKTVKNRKFEDATTIGADNKKTSLKKQKKEKRDTKVIFLADQWIYEATNPIVQAANEKAGWNFQWTIMNLCSLQNIILKNIMVGIQTL